MNKFVWSNRYLPQTLYISVILAYFRGGAAVVGLILPGFFGTYTSFGYLLILSGVLGAFGVANLRWWGYLLSLVSSILTLLTFNGLLTELISIRLYVRVLFSSGNLINLLFDVVIIALLVHPMSTKYVKANFEKSIP